LGNQVTSNLYLTYHSYQNLTERVVKSRLVDNLHNYFQSAHIKHYSTETTLLSVHDHHNQIISKATSHQQVTCLALLHLSAAFDTIDHSVHLHHSLIFRLKIANRSLYYSAPVL